MISAGGVDAIDAGLVGPRLETISEPTGPADLISRGTARGQLEESDGFEFTGPTSAPASIASTPPAVSIQTGPLSRVAASPAISTVVLFWPTVFAPNVVLNALSTFDEGNASASSAAAELSAGTVRRIADVHDSLARQLWSGLGNDGLERRVQHGEDDDVNVTLDGRLGVGRTDVLDDGTGGQHPHRMAVPMLPDPKIVTSAIAPIVVSPLGSARATWRMQFNPFKTTRCA